MSGQDTIFLRVLNTMKYDLTGLPAFAQSTLDFKQVYLEHRNKLTFRYC